MTFLFDLLLTYLFLLGQQVKDVELKVRLIWRGTCFIEVKYYLSVYSVNLVQDKGCRCYEVIFIMIYISLLFILFSLVDFRKIMF